MDRQEIQQIATRFIGTEGAAKWDALLRPAARVVPDSARASQAVLLGGPAAPLPPDIPWPEWDGVPLHFLAAVDCPSVHATLPECPLPATGTLLFFVEGNMGIDHPSGLGPVIGALTPASRPSWRVIHTSGRYVKPRLPPAGQSPLFNPRPVTASLRLEWTWPEGADYRSVIFPSEAEEMWLLLDELSERRGYDPLHQIGGWPLLLQGDPTAEVALAAASGGVNQTGTLDYSDGQRVDRVIAGSHDAWWPLLQLDTDETPTGPGWMWGDSGVMYFMGEPSKLRETDVEDVWMTWACL